MGKDPKLVKFFQETVNLATEQNMDKSYRPNQPTVRKPKSALHYGRAAAKNNVITHIVSTSDMQIKKHAEIAVTASNETSQMGRNASSANRLNSANQNSQQ